MSDPRIFWRRLSELHNSLLSDGCWNNAEAIVIPTDPASDEAAFNKSSAVFIHLFGIELHDSLVMLCKGALHVVTSSKKCTMLETLQNDSPAEAPRLVLHRFASAGSTCFNFLVFLLL